MRTAEIPMAVMMTVSAKIPMEVAHIRWLR
jgi:hypothetical protein